MVHRSQHGGYSTTGPNKNRAVLIWHHRVPFTCLPPFASFGDCRQKTRSIGDSLNKFLKLGGPTPPAAPLWNIINSCSLFLLLVSISNSLCFFRCNLYFLLHTRLIEIFLTSQIYQVYFCYYRASPKWCIITSNTPRGNLEQYDTIRHRKNSMRQYVTESMILYVTAKSSMILYITT